MKPSLKQKSRCLNKAPTTVSRYCEPFSNDFATRRTVHVLDAIGACSGQAIIRTSKILLPEINCEAMIQGKIFTGNSLVSNIIRNEIAPGFVSAKTMLNMLSKYTLEGRETAVYFKPLIFGVNENDLLELISSVQDYGVNKIVIRQLFATECFRSYLSFFISNRDVRLLTEQVRDYYTYDNFDLLNKLYNVFNEAEKRGVLLSFCGNEYLNKLICKANNCCLYEGARHD
jgi:hypothetical protein